MAFDERIDDKLKEKVIPTADLQPPAIDGRVEITFDPEGTVANMVLYAPQNGGRPITAEMVIEELNKNGVVEGIDDFDITDMVKEEVYETPICVARAIPPRRGKNGFVTYRFDKEHNLKPKQNEFGIANYRELNSIVPIRKGDIIADITLPTPGEPGMNIFGKPIPPEPGIAAKVTVGKNTQLTADGKAIVAAVDGHIIYGTGCFIVEDTVTVKADLDISIGNINFFGDVHVRGNVMEGFSITAGKNVRIDGTIFGGNITAGGNINIVGGCLNTKVDCEGNFNAGFCENAVITAKGNVESKQFAFCDVFSYGAVTAKGMNGVIVGGKITSMHDVTAGIIGSEKYTSTELNIGDGSVIFARKKQAEEELADSSEAYNTACKNLEFLKHRKHIQGGLLTEAQQRQVKMETQNKLFHAMRKREMAALIAQLEEDMRNKDALCAKATNIIYPGARFCINFLTLEVTEAARRGIVAIVDDKLTVIGS